MNDQERQDSVRRIRKRIEIHVGLAIAALVVAMGVGAAGFVYWGAYNVSALQQHTEPVFTLLNLALDRSIRQRAEEIEVPSLTPDMAEEGRRLYQARCVQCHGAPGVGRDDVGKGMTPVPPNLAHTAKAKSAAELFWPIKHGIKMTGMPSWQFKFTDEQIWTIVAFIMQMPEMSPADYQALRGGDAREPPRDVTTVSASAPARAAAEPDPARGKLALYGYACIACHRIPGTVGPHSDVGPPLAGIGGRRYIAGVLANTPENMVHWLRHPTEVDPLTAMPDLDVTEQDALDMAAYLETLK
ncbi:c-type cytochrome [Halomonas sp. MCCC 1A17488]|uniref:C-type cytochrome n=1 Tax=Billgrantia sulfidoxydans TaxID=2733484 RepID=A0ABX7W0R8_9GAMM|nr:MULTISPECIES: c-type cytochrome [Halomonas]MCE8016368.1 c-type cytochrome [Halomonas sp. MCCC 1A17488]MCG3239701.1 c-type cytochrome [Halomonas sp. MCCC 1A17488]QPP50390.1 c-type cytochrome [Halomonas sp. SS10-MC5]QTP54009.1 c-type cytochrome [Halomonas sulfidoxydans]